MQKYRRPLLNPGPASGRNQAGWHRKGLSAGQHFYGNLFRIDGKAKFKTAGIRHLPGAHSHMCKIGWLKTGSFQPFEGKTRLVLETGEQAAVIFQNPKYIPEGLFGVPVLALVEAGTAAVGTELFVDPALQGGAAPQATAFVYGGKHSFSRV
jgi:hypothetical protein